VGEREGGKKNPKRSDSLGDTVGLARIDSLAGLFDLLQHRLVGDGVLGGDICGLILEGDSIGFDT